MATPAKFVQFRTIEDAIEAYNERAVPAWSIWNSKQFLTKYEGDDLATGAGLLQSFLEKLATSPAIYTICVYEDWPAGVKIKDTTPYDGSFNVRLSEWNGGLGNAPVPYQDPQIMNRMLSVLTAMDTRMKAVEEKIAKEDQGEDDDDDEDQGIVGAVDRILSHPLIEPLIPAIVDKIGAWLGPAQPGNGHGQPKPNGQGQAAASSGVRISGVAEVEAAHSKAIQLVARDHKIAESIVTLDEKIGKDLPDLLLKLAKLAEHRPMQFKIYKAMFDKMKI